MSTAVPTPAPTTADEASSDEFAKFLSALYTNLAVACVCFVIFGQLHHRYKWCFYYRANRLESGKVPDVPSDMFSWIKIMWRMSDDDLLRAEIGVDALMYLRFLDLGFKFFSSVLPLAAILILLNKFGDVTDADPPLDSFKQLTLGNVQDGSHILWVYCLGSYAMTGYLCYLLYQEYRYYYNIRHSTHVLTDTRSVYNSKVSRSALMQKIPKDVQNEKSLNELFSSLYPGTLDSSALAYDTRKADELIAEREKLFRKWEHATVVYEMTSERPLTRTVPIVGKKVDAIEYFAEEIKKKNEEIEAMQDAGFKPTSNAIVTFKTFGAIGSAVQMKQTLDPLAYDNKLAPNPSEIKWENLVQSSSERRVRDNLGTLFVVLLVVFWTIPVTLASTLTNLDTLTDTIPGLEELLEAVPALGSFLQGFLPGLALTIFQSILPSICVAIASFRGLESVAWIDADAFKSFFYFQLFNFYLASAIGGAFIASAEEIADEPTSIVSLLSESLPGQALTFMSYIMLISLSTFPILLTNISSLIVGALKLKYLAKTEYEKEEAIKPKFMKYHSDYPKHLLVFMIGLAYAPLAPLLVPFVALFFAIAKVIFRFRLVYLMPVKCDGGGTLFPLVFNRIIVGLYVAQITLLGVLGLKEFFGSPLIIIQIILTSLFKSQVNATFEQSSNALCREELVKLDRNLNQVTDDRHASDPSIFLSPAITATAISLKAASSEKKVADEEEGIKNRINSSATRDQVEIVAYEK